MKNGLPDRWTKYMNIGSRISGTCFVPLKVPLSDKFFKTRPLIVSFTPSMVIDAVTNLATVIDLTNTNRYYHPKEFTDRRVVHKKIFCMGHEIPNGNVVQNFFAAVDDHLNRSSLQGTDSVIGVHCTHGINRTGYLICLYMIKRLGFTPNDALKAFGEARGHPVERKNYIDDLLRLSVDGTSTGDKSTESQTRHPRECHHSSRRRHKFIDQYRPMRHPNEWRHREQIVKPGSRKTTDNALSDYRIQSSPNLAPPGHSYNWRHRPQPPPSTRWHPSSSSSSSSTGETMANPEERLWYLDD